MPVPGPGGCEVSPRRARGWISRSAHGVVLSPRAARDRQGRLRPRPGQIAIAARAASCRSISSPRTARARSSNLENLDDGPRGGGAVDRGRRAHPGEQLLPDVVLGRPAVYVEMLVEKMDLKSLFTRACASTTSRSPTPAAGPTSTAGRDDGALRQAGKPRQAIVLLYCGDLDPAGCRSPSCIKSNIATSRARSAGSPTI